MKTLIVAAAALLAAGSATAAETMQEVQSTAPAVIPPQPIGQGGPAHGIALLPGAEESADCGGLLGLAGQAFCVSAPLVNVGALAEAYIADLETQGWLAAGGDENRVVFVKRREGGGCDGMQMQAFYDTSRPVAPATVGYLGFATIPGNVCAAATPAASTATPQ